MSRKALVTGSFDPPTVGHLDLVSKVAACFENVVVCIFRNSEKSYMFSEAERKEMLVAMVAEACLDNVTVDVNEGYVADYAKANDITCVVRGVRGVMDIDYEMDMAHYNKKRNPALETFLWLAPKWQEDISSTRARISIRNGVMPEDICTKAVVDLIKKFSEMG